MYGTRTNYSRRGNLHACSVITLAGPKWHSTIACMIALACVHADVRSFTHVCVRAPMNASVHVCGSGCVRALVKAYAPCALAFSCLQRTCHSSCRSTRRRQWQLISRVSPNFPCSIQESAMAMRTSICTCLSGLLVDEYMPALCAYLSGYLSMS